MNTLTPTDRRRYAALKAEIQAGLMNVAAALYEIREKKLYLEEYKTFGDFIENECDYSRPRVYQLIKAVEGQKKLSTNVDKSEPVNSTVARAVADIPDAHVAAVIEAATEGGTKPATAAAVKRVTAEIVTPDVTPHVTPHVTPQPDETPAAKFRKLRSVAKQHNAAMIRAIDSMHELIMNPGTHRKLVQHYEAIDKLLEGWPV